MPQRLGNELSRRIPLGDVPNAANSPARTHTATKRSRDTVQAQENFYYDAQPEAKRQVLGRARPNVRLSPAKQSLRSQEDRVFTKRSLNPHLTAFERRCLAAREVKARQRVETHEKTPPETLESIKQWQKHYKKAFPQFIFYFEAISEDVRQKCSKWVRNLGAREEKFFSKDVTHVVTSRPIPATTGSKDGTGMLQPQLLPRASQIVGTINPSLLDRHGSANQGREKPVLDAPTSRRPMFNRNRELDRRSCASNTDILLKAQEMGMKVWQIEKLQRIMNTMHELPNEHQTYQAPHTRIKTNNAAVQEAKGAELSRMLHNERLHGPSDRDPSVALSEIVPFKGPYIYIRDLDERTKPIMMKEFARPVQKGDLGDWPQFRAASHGKCPFVEETTKDNLAKVKVRQEQEPVRQQVPEAPKPSRTHTAAQEGPYEDQAPDEVETDLSQREEVQRPLRENSNAANVSAPPPGKPYVSQFCPPPARLPRSPSKAQRTVPAAVRPNLFGGEPAASGLQHSQITSAIRSQMISSTAAGPGVKAGTSKEVHGLTRKVLEKNAGPALSNVQSRQNRIDAVMNARVESNIAITRQSRRRVEETLVHIDEESTQSENDDDVCLAQAVGQGTKASTKEQKKKFTKPGFCENCREKYEDFHVVRIFQIMGMSH
ncbi:MAG: hypothetical protein Q9163_004742 [Psora crenata]